VLNVMQISAVLIQEDKTPRLGLPTDMITKAMYELSNV